MKFIVEIELGNEAMQTPWDLARELRDAARRLTADYEDEPVSEFGLGKHWISDVNGNRVGFYTTKED